MSRPEDIKPPPPGHGKRILGTMIVMAGTGIALDTPCYGLGLAVLGGGAFLAALGALQGSVKRGSGAGAAGARGPE